MNGQDFRKKLMEYRISTGREPFWIYINYKDYDELIADTYFPLYFLESYIFKINEKVNVGELIMKSKPLLVIQPNGVITADSHPVGNIEYEPEWREIKDLTLYWKEIF